MTANPMLVGTGASIVAGDIAAEGAKDAAEEQKKAADKAIATQKVAADKAEQAFTPYQQTGHAALGQLGQFMGFPSTGTAAGTAGGISLGALPANAQADVGLRPGMETPGKAIARNPAAGAGTPQAQAAMQSQSGYQPTGQSVGMFAGGQLVQMKAPTGETSWVPKTQAPFYAQRGAIEVA